MWRTSVRMMRRRDQWMGLIVVSADWPEFARLRAWRPSGYLHKPLRIDDLVRVIQNLARDAGAVAKEAA
jgi:DNA-binding response OmpR family regulator